MTSKTDITVSKLVDMIKTGELSLPEMQRGYVWRADRVRDLLDSLYRGYPSGTILVWETEQSVPNRELALRQGESPFKGHKLLLDGQQRLTSLASILRGEPVMVHGSRKPIDILFNLDHPEGPPRDDLVDSDADEADDESEVDDDNDDDDDDAVTSTSPIQERTRNLAFAKASRALLSQPNWIRVADIFAEKPDHELLERALPGGWKDPNWKKYAERVQRVRRIRDYSYVMQVLDRTMEYEEVAEIFVRVNSRGVKLRSSDLALAQITSRWRDSLRLFEEFRDACVKKGYALDVGIIVRALVVFATGKSRFKTVGSLTRPQLEEAWPTAQAQILWALDYLRSLRIDNVSLLSSPFLIVALAYYREYHPKLDSSELRDLRRWFLYSNARGHYSRGSTETLLDADLNLIRERRGIDALFELLQRQVGRLEFTARDLAGSSPLSPLFPVVFLALRDQGAIDLQNGTPLTLPESGRARLDNWHYAFADRKLEAERSERMEISNTVFVSAAKRGHKSIGSADKWLAKALAEHGEGALRLHGLPAAPELYKPTTFRAFLEYRRQALADLLNKYIDGTTERALSPTHLRALIAGGETDRVEFKQRAVNDSGQVLDYVSKEVASFLNTTGGTLIVGVDDDGALVGIGPDVDRLNKKKTEDNYQKIIVDHLLTLIGKAHSAFFRVSLAPVDGKKVCVIEVDKSPSAAYVTPKGGQSVFYARIGNQVQPLVGQDLDDYRRNRDT